MYVALRVAQSLGAVGSFDDEDGWTLAAAWELLHGPHWPYQAYQLSDWECGTRLVVWLTAPFVMMLGPSLLALKLAGLTISTCTLAGVYVTCRRCYGLSAALFAAWLYAFFPAPIFTYSVTAHGFHPDSMALQVLFLWLAAGFLVGPRSRWRMFLTGVAGGFAIYFAYISAIAVLGGLIPLLWMVLRRKGLVRATLPALAGGLVVGGAPLLLYNLLNGFRGLVTYHGSLASYVAPTEALDRVDRFQRFTLEASRGFSDLFLNDPGRRGQFELAFWAAALAALLMPYLVRAAAGALGRSSVEHREHGRRFLDAAVLFMALLTFGIFFVSGHPVGVMHMVPLLVALLLVIAGRLGSLWSGGGIAGKLLAGGLLACFLSVCAPHHLKQIRPGRMKLAASMEARHYHLWLFRAQRVFEARKDQLRQDAVRHLSMMVPLELAKNDEHRVHLATSAIIASPDPGASLVKWLQAPPRLTIPYDPFQTAGLVLVNLLARPETTGKSLTDILKAMPPDGVSTSVETLGFHVRAGGQKFEKIQKEIVAALKQSPELGEAGIQAFAQGVGRASALSLVLPGGGVLCRYPELPKSAGQAYVKGLGKGLARHMLVPVPRWAEEKVCKEHRAAFWQAVKEAGPPNEQILAKAKGLD